MTKSLIIILGLVEFIYAHAVGPRAAAFKLPPVHGKTDYQIGGAYTPASDVAIVHRDRSDPAVPGLYNICYINAFQSQPDEAAWWKSESFARVSQILHTSLTAV